MMPTTGKRAAASPRRPLPPRLDASLYEQAASRPAGPVRPRAEIVEEGFTQRPFAWIRCLWIRFDRSRSLGLGAEMAFWLFLSLLPLAAVAGLITAKFVTGNGSALTLLLESLPRAMREMVGSELGRVAAWNGGKVGVKAGAIFIWLASSGIHSIFDGLELASDAVPRPWWKKRLLAIGTCVALSLGTALLAVLGTGLGWRWGSSAGSSGSGCHPGRESPCRSRRARSWRSGCTSRWVSLTASTSSRRATGAPTRPASPRSASR